MIWKNGRSSQNWCSPKKGYSSHPCDIQVYVPQTAAMTFTFPFVFILLIWVEAFSMRFFLPGQLILAQFTWRMCAGLTWCSPQPRRMRGRPAPAGRRAKGRRHAPSPAGDLQRSACAVKSFIWFLFFKERSKGRGLPSCTQPSRCPTAQRQFLAGKGCFATRWNEEKD